MSKELNAAIKLLTESGYSVKEPPQETEYKKALRTGKRPSIWPPIVMTREDLEHFRSTFMNQRHP